MEIQSWSLINSKGLQVFLTKHRFSFWVLLVQAPVLTNVALSLHDKKHYRTTKDSLRLHSASWTLIIIYVPLYYSSDHCLIVT